MRARLQKLLPLAEGNYKIAVYYAVVVLFHIAGWSLFLYYGHRYGAVYAAAGGLAYSLGLRHAFDADHVAAIDDTTRYLMQRGRDASGTGFYFSLGHSTVVIVLSVAIALVSVAALQAMPGLQSVGGTVGTAVSGTFLIIIAILDFVILRGLIDIWRKYKSGTYTAEHLDRLMAERGLMNRVLGGRWRKFMKSSWHMYPLGILFGLGFDTATEVGLLALTSVAATSGEGIAVGAILALPLLFTAGMTLMDTTDGILMIKAYGWALTKPIRKIYYNIVAVGLGVFIAAFIGIIQYLKLLADHTGQQGAFWRGLEALDFEMLGYAIVVVFLGLWVASIVFYKVRRIDERYDAMIESP